MTLSTEFSSLADRATKGEVIVTECCDYWVQTPPSDADPEGRSIAHCGDIEWPNFRERQYEWEANAAFIAFCFNHRAEIAVALQVMAALKDANAVERLARLMWVDTTDKDYWDHLDEGTKNIYRSNARAVIAAILKGDKNAEG